MRSHWKLYQIGSTELYGVFIADFYEVKDGLIIFTNEKKHMLTPEQQGFYSTYENVAVVNLAPGMYLERSDA